MKAIRVHQTGGPEVLKLEVMPEFDVTDGHVLVRIHAAGINPVETYVRSGRYPVSKRVPYTPGSDGAGEVLRVGAGVKQFKKGDRVYLFAPFSSGTYAEQTLCDAKDVFALPDNVSFAQGAAIGVPYATAYRALFGKAHAQPGEIVLVHGASGGVGLAATQIARAHGLSVLGTAGTPEGRKIVEEQGAHAVFDHTRADYLEEIAGFNCGRGPDIVLEMLANENLQKDLGIIAPFGRIVIIGNRGTLDFDPRLAMGKDATITGMTLFNVPPDELKAIHAALGAGLENGNLRPIIREEIPLEDAPRAHELVMQPGAFGKIVLVPYP